MHPVLVGAGQEDLPGGAGCGLPQLFFPPLGAVPDAGRPSVLRTLQHGHGGAAQHAVVLARALLTRDQVLNALSIDPGRQWKGVWRWFSESQLQVRGLSPVSGECTYTPHAVLRRQRHSAAPWRYLRPIRVSGSLQWCRRRRAPRLRRHIAAVSANGCCNMQPAASGQVLFFGLQVRPITFLPAATAPALTPRLQLQPRDVWSDRGRTLVARRWLSRWARHGSLHVCSMRQLQSSDKLVGFAAGCRPFQVPSSLGAAAVAL